MKKIVALAIILEVVLIICFIKTAPTPMSDSEMAMFKTTMQFYPQGELK